MGKIWDSTPHAKHRRPATRTQEQRRLLIRLAIACATLCTLMAIAATAPAALLGVGWVSSMSVVPVWGAGYLTALLLKASGRTPNLWPVFGRAR